MSSIVFFGNEKLATGIKDCRPIILESVVSAGFELEQHVTGPISELKPHKSKLAILAAYGHLVPQRVIDEFPLGIINVHPSLLPRYRGSTPIESAMLDGVDKTGVSIMRLTAGMDEGPIFKQKTLKLSGKETKQELAEALQKLGAELLVDMLPALRYGQLKPRKQPHVERDVSYTKRISKEDGCIDWVKPAMQLEREVRAYAGWPRSRTNFGGIEVIVTKAHSIPVNHDGAKPGDIEIVREAGVIMVECINGSICVERLQPAGKNEMSAGEFISGYGSRLGL